MRVYQIHYNNGEVHTVPEVETPERFAFERALAGLLGVKVVHLLNGADIVRSYRPGGAGRPIRLNKGQRFALETERMGR
jgi:hypothetical protein